MSGHVRSCPLKWSRMIKVSRVNKTSSGTAKSSASQSVSSCFFASRAFVHLQRQLISASETLLPKTEDLYTIFYQSPVCWQMLANCQPAITWCRCSFLNAASTGVAKRVSGQRLQFVTLCHTLSHFVICQWHLQMTNCGRCCPEPQSSTPQKSCPDAGYIKMRRHI